LKEALKRKKLPGC